MSSTTLFTMSIQIPDSEAPIRYRIRCSPSAHTDVVAEQCAHCVEENCWCIASARQQRKEAAKQAKLEAREVMRAERVRRCLERMKRRIRMQVLRAQHAAQTKQLKENPMTWIERPYIFGRFETLLAILRGRAAFANIKDEEVVALMPAYAVWLWNTTQEFEVRGNNGNVTTHVINRWQLMNNFVDNLELRHK